MACQALLDVEQHSSFADDTLDRLTQSAGLEARDRALAFELVYGVFRRRSTLDWRLAQIADRPLDRLPLIVRMALRLGAYQLFHLERVPPSAAVNESVALVKASGKHWTGFVNAMLRTLAKAPAPMWPDPIADPALAYGIQYGCPQWLAQRWIDRYGSTRAQALCEATLAVPPLTLRVNILRVNRESLLQAFLKAGVEARATDVSPVGVVVEARGLVTRLPLFEEGGFYVEDEGAQLIAPILDPQPGERVLDACAAPGGKASHLAVLMQDQGEIVAVERAPPRARLLKENCQRLGIGSITVWQADIAQRPVRAGVGLAASGLNEALRKPFDRVLLDAPCSGLGVLRRHPEGKWLKTEAGLAQHAREQSTLLDRVSLVLRPGGVLVYSTCSTEPEENEQIIDGFLQRHPDFSRESVALWLPETGRSLITPEGHFSTIGALRSMDGFFAARLRKGD